LNKIYPLTMSRKSTIIYAVKVYFNNITAQQPIVSNVDRYFDMITTIEAGFGDTAVAYARKYQLDIKKYSQWQLGIVDWNYTKCMAQQCVNSLQNK
jgi:hypothetical protein